MMPWVVDPEVLILEVESRPLLYAKTLPEYSNKILKNNTWEDVGKKLSEDWETLTNEEKISRSKDIQAKWKHLRDNFRREYQAQKENASGQGAKKRKKYRYYDQLLFLIPHVKDAKTSGNYSTTANISEENTKSPLKIQNSPVGPSTVTRSETPKKKKITTSTFEDAILKAINNEISEADEDKTFCLSLVQSLKKMDDDNKMLAKIEILKVIRTFTNKSHNTYNSEQNQSPFYRPNVVPFWNHPNSNFSVQSTPLHSQITQQQQSQPTSTKAHSMYQQQSESNPTLLLHQSSSINPVHQSNVIQILENQLYRPANFTAQSSRPQSTLSYFTTFNSNICPSPSNIDSLSSTTVQSPLLLNVSSPEEYPLSPDDCLN